MSTPRAGTATVGRPRRAVATVVLVVFVDLLGFGVIIPILPYYVRSFGVSDVYIGLLAASYSLMQFVFAPLLGRLSDRHGRRPVIMLSLTGSAVAWTVFGLASAVWMLFVSRLLAGAMGGNIAAAQAYVADVTPEARRAESLGLVGAAFGLGFVFGPAIGGFFASDTVVTTADGLLPDVVPTTRFSVPSFAAAALSLCSFGLAATFLEEPDRVRSRGPRETVVGQFATALGDDRLRGLVVAFFLLSLAFSGVQVMFIPFVADAYGYDASQAALLLTYVGVWGVFVQGVLVGRLTRRVPIPWIALGGSVALTAALALLPFSPLVGDLLPIRPVSFLTPPLLVLLLALPLLSLGNGLLSVGLTTLVSTAASAETQGRAFGVTQGAGSLGRTVGPPIMAALYAAAVYWSPFVVGALLVLPVFAILVGMIRRAAVATVSSR
ncbi:MFS transporter [Natribaculum luteum]|uniref:MFS transporter n=1 Tax=Natribaculum luteum TaxID=1586232 RepID=A0ABD5NZE8_9EURY|nr:MFS transporter [Natribaculum luteum]